MIHALAISTNVIANQAELSKEQIWALGQFFQVDPGMFFNDRRSDKFTQKGDRLPQFSSWIGVSQTCNNMMDGWRKISDLSKNRVPTILENWKQ
jgi:hypothetical protein